MVRNLWRRSSFFHCSCRKPEFQKANTICRQMHGTDLRLAACYWISSLDYSLLGRILLSSSSDVVCTNAESIRILPQSPRLQKQLLLQCTKNILFHSPTTTTSYFLSAASNGPVEVKLRAAEKRKAGTRRAPNDAAAFIIIVFTYCHWSCLLILVGSFVLLRLQLQSTRSRRLIVISVSRKIARNPIHSCQTGIGEGTTERLLPAS